MSHPQKNYDSRCGDLARAFLRDDAPESDIISLAQHIQDAIEDWLLENDV